MVILLHSVSYNKLERVFFETTGKKYGLFLKNSLLNQNFYLALSTRFSDIQMLLSQSSSLKELINFIAVLGKP